MNKKTYIHLLLLAFIFNCIDIIITCYLYNKDGQTLTELNPLFDYSLQNFPLYFSSIIKLTIVIPWFFILYFTLEKAISKFGTKLVFCSYGILVIYQFFLLV